MKSSYVKRMYLYLFALVLAVLPEPASADNNTITANKQSPKTDMSPANRCKSSGSYCGIYCLYAVIKLSDINIDPVELLKPEYIGSPRGSSLAELKKAAEDNGMHAVLVNSLTYAKAYRGNIPTEEQVAKLAAAAWKERPHSIDVTLYRESTTPPKPIEQIRKEVEGFFENERNMIQQKYEPNSEGMKIMLKRLNKAIEMNVNSWVKRQQFPRLARRRIRNAGHNHRADSVTAEPGEEIEPNMPFEGTYVNVGERNSSDFFSFDYQHKIKKAIIEDESGWARRDPAKFVGLPLGTASALQALLGGTNQGDPDPNKMQELSSTGLAKIDHAAGVVRVRVTVTPDPNTPDTRVRIEIGDPNYLPTTVMICDREDYSRVYYVELCSRRTGEPFYVRECSNFDSQGFPHNATEIKYDIDGNFEEKSVYRIIKVDLNPTIPDEVFKFKPPEDYEADDRRPPEKRPQNVNYLRTEDVRKTLREVHKAFQKRDLTTLKEFLKHKSWRVRSNALALITGVAEGEELKKIVESMRKDKKDEVREQAELILKRLQK